MMRVFFTRLLCRRQSVILKKVETSKKDGGRFHCPWISPLYLGWSMGYLWCCFSRRGTVVPSAVVWKINYVSFFAQHSRCTETHLTQTQDYIEAIIYHRLRMTPMVIAKIFTDKKNVACWLQISMMLNDTCVPRFWGPGPSSPPL